MSAQKVIKTARTVWASPVVVVPEKDGALFLFVDYKELYSEIKWDSRQMFRMYKCLDSMRGAAEFSALVAKREQQQTEVDENNREKI